MRKIYTGDARESRKIQEDKLVFTGLFYYELYPVELTKRAKKEYKEPFKGSDEPTGKPAFYVLDGNGDLEIRSKPPASDARALQAELFVGTLTYYQVHGINQKNNPYHV